MKRVASSFAFIITDDQVLLVFVAAFPAGNVY